MHRDLGLDERPDDDEFDDFILHVDGWLCEIKDAQIRDGLHVLGAGARRARPGSTWCSRSCAPRRSGAGSRSAVPGPARGARAQGGRRGHRRGRRDRGAGPRPGRSAMEDAGWDPAAASTALHDDPEVAAGAGVRRRPQVVPRLAGTTDELDAVLHALDGGFVPAGPSGSPLRGLVNVLPTGRNFYTVDPRAVPSRLAWRDRAGDGRLAARALPRRHRRATRVGRACRCGARQRDAHLRRRHRRGARAARRPPGWDEASRRVTRPRRRPARRARPAAHRRHRAHLRLLPRRLPARGRDARRRGPAGRRRSTSRPTRTSSAPTPRPTSPSTATSAGPRPGSSARKPGLVRRRHPAARSSPATGATTPTSPRSTRPGAASPTAAASTARRRPTTCGPTTGGSRSRPRTSTPASTTSPTPTTTSSTTAAWSPPSAR